MADAFPLLPLHPAPREGGGGASPWAGLSLSPLARRGERAVGASCGGTGAEAPEDEGRDFMSSVHIVVPYLEPRCVTQGAGARLRLPRLPSKHKEAALCHAKASPPACIIRGGRGWIGGSHVGRLYAAVPPAPAPLPPLLPPCPPPLGLPRACRPARPRPRGTRSPSWAPRRACATCPWTPRTSSERCAAATGASAGAPHSSKPLQTLTAKRL